MYITEAYYLSIISFFGVLQSNITARVTNNPNLTSKNPIQHFPKKDIFVLFFLIYSKGNYLKRYKCIYVICYNNQIKLHYIQPHSRVRAALHHSQLPLFRITKEGVQHNHLVQKQIQIQGVSVTTQLKINHYPVMSFPDTTPNNHPLDSHTKS